MDVNDPADEGGIDTEHWTVLHEAVASDNVQRIAGSGGR